ncbi:hypothetical protein FO436_04485 [Weissella cibaria]|uniref:hypothetical protein n=1 Tax=Weissella cibaria TaxID=137591 RepID=UPI00118F7341|nr:hypothetical protein [Weissella cibaria]TVV33891.1 hypothetical protein FO436_04485 [Weissella cibaria]
MRKTMVLTLLAATSFGLVTVGQAHAATTSYTTTFKYVDATTNKTLKTVKTTGSKNKTYTYKPVAIKYYATPAKLSYKVTKASTITLKVKATYRKATVKYVDRYNNATIKTATTKMVPVGKTTSFTPVSVSGYQVTSTATKKLANVKLDSTVTFTYDKLFKLTQNMVAMDTKKSLGTSSQTVKRGQTVTLTPKLVANYVTPAVQMIQVNKDTTATFNYQRLYNVTINSVGSDGVKLGSVKHTVQQGQTVTAMPKNYAGYATPISQKVAPNKDMTVTLTYPKFYTVNVVEKAADGTVLTTRSMQGQAGQSVKLTPESHEGYVAPKDQTVDQATTVTFIYQIDRTHQDDAYNKLIASLDNQDQSKLALATYKADYTQATTLASYQAAQQVMSTMALKSLGGQAMRIVDSYNSNDIIAGKKMGASDIAMADGSNDVYIAYFASGDYDWVVDQTTKQAGWIKQSLLTTDGVGMRDGDAYTYKVEKKSDLMGSYVYVGNDVTGTLDSYTIQYGINGNYDDAVVKFTFNKDVNVPVKAGDFTMEKASLFVGDSDNPIMADSQATDWTNQQVYSVTFSISADDADELIEDGGYVGYGSVSDLGEKPHAFNLPGENSGDYSTSV